MELFAKTMDRTWNLKTTIIWSCAPQDHRTFCVTSSRGGYIKDTSSPWFRVILQTRGSVSWHTNQKGYIYKRPVVHGPMGCSQKSVKLVWRCHQLLSWFLSKDHLFRVSRQSLWSANDKGDNEMIPGAEHRYPDIFLTAEKNPVKSQLGERRWRLCD